MISPSSVASSSWFGSVLAVVLFPDWQEVVASFVLLVILATIVGSVIYSRHFHKWIQEAFADAEPQQDDTKFPNLRESPRERLDSGPPDD